MQELHLTMGNFIDELTLQTSQGLKLLQETIGHATTPTHDSTRQEQPFDLAHRLCSVILRALMVIQGWAPVYPSERADILLSGVELLMVTLISFPQIHFMATSRVLVI